MRGAELLRRRADRLHQLRRQLLAHLRQLDDRHHVLVDRVDDGLRRAARRDQAVPGVGFHVDAALFQRRHVRQIRRALGGRHRQDFHLAGLRQRRHRDRRQAGHLRVVADHRRDRRRRAGVGHVHDLRAGLERERLHGEMRQRAVADRGEVVFAGIGLHQRDQLTDSVDLEIEIDRQRARLRDELRDRRDVLARIVGQGREQQRVDGERSADADADGRAVGLGLGHQVGARYCRWRPACSRPRRRCPDTSFAAGRR